MGSKGQTPWISLNGVEMCDSQLVMDHLTQHYQMDITLDIHLTKEQRAVAKAFITMVDEHLIWSVLSWTHYVTNMT